mgnify:CR=1 FL=1
MHKVNVDELFAGKQSKYALVVVLQESKRDTAEQEESGEVTDDKPVLIAIDEIKNHEIGILEPDDDELQNS